MLKRIRIWALLLLSPLLLGVGAYGYLWWQVETAAQALVQALRPALALEYERVHLDPRRNEVGLDAIRLTPAGFTQSVTITGLRLRTPDRLFWLMPEQRLRQGAWPALLSVAVQGLQVDLAALAAELPAAVSVPPGELDLSRLSPCGDEALLQQMVQMGYGRLSHDLELSYYTDSGLEQVTLDLRLMSEKVAEMSIHLQLPLAARRLDQAGLMQGIGDLQLLRLNYQDRGYNRVRNSFCADRTSLLPEQVLQRDRDALAQLFNQLRLKPAPALLDALVDLNRSGAQLSALIRPQRNLLGAPLPASPEALLALLRPGIEINGKALPLQGLLSALQEPAAAAQAEPPEQPAVTASAAAPVAALPAASSDARGPEPVVSTDSSRPYPEPVAKAFQPVAVSELARFRGYRVRLKTYFGRIVAGRLVAVEAGLARLEEQHERGTATYPLALDKIETAEVYR